MEKDIASRLGWLLETKKLSASQLAKHIGIQKSSLSHIMSGRNKPSFDFMLKLKKAFPDLDLDWFITGEGNAFENGISSPPISNSNNEKVQKKLDFDTQKNAMNTNQSDEGIQKTNPVYKSKQDDLNSVLLIFEDETFKILKPRKE